MRGAPVPTLPAPSASGFQAMVGGRPPLEQQHHQQLPPGGGGDADAFPQLPLSTAGKLPGPASYPSAAQTMVRPPAVQIFAFIQHSCNGRGFQRCLA